MGLFGKIGLGTMAGLLFLACSMPVYAEAFSYEPCYQAPEGNPDGYVVLEEELGEYEVCQGDCLWDISERFLGSGEAYLRLMEMNPGVVTDPDLIYPHTVLRMKRNVYVRKGADAAGTQMGLCRFGGLPGYTVGLTQAGDAYSSLVFTRTDGARVVCRIRDKEPDGADTLSDWEGCRETIEEYAEGQYGEQVSDLGFSRYRSGGGNEIYLFSYVYTVFGEAYGLKGTLPVYVSHGICQTEHILAEFVGFHTEEGMEDVVRYLTAGFEELSPVEPGAHSGDMGVGMNDYNITMGSTKEWELPGVYNSFGWIEEYFDGMIREAVPLEPEERSARDRVLNPRG